MLSNNTCLDEIQEEKFMTLHKQEPLTSGLCKITFHKNIKINNNNNNNKDK